MNKLMLGNKLMSGALMAAGAAVVGLSPLSALAANGPMDREQAARMATERRQPVETPTDRAFDRTHEPKYQYNKSNGCSRYQYWEPKEHRTVVKEHCTR